jgi:hypothetical protein
LPDFSGTIYQNGEKYTRLPHHTYTKISNGRKIDQMYQHLTLQYPPEFTQTAISWTKNLPSGNPAADFNASVVQLKIPRGRERLGCANAGVHKRHAYEVVHRGMLVLFVS